jgi:DnaJ-class molecular chaperone
MANEEIMSRAEIMSAIEEGDRHAGVLAEATDDKFKVIMETYDVLDKKIDGVDRKLEDFRGEANMKFSLLFGDNQRFFEELRATRKESEERFGEIFKRFDSLEKRD